MLSADLGYGNVKLFGGLGRLVMASQVATDGRDEVHSLALRGRRRPLEVATDAGSFFVGLGAHDWGRPVENLDFERFIGSPEMVALLCGAWSKYGLGDGEEVEMIVGLPLGCLSGDEDTVKDNVKRIRSFMKGEHRWTADGEARSLTVSDVQMASQVDGTLFDYLLDEDGVMSPARKKEFKGELAILNIGFNTVDLLVSRKGQAVQRFTGGDTRGVRRLLEIAGEGLYSLGELDQKLRARDLDVSTALPIWAREVLALVESQWGRSWRRFSRVIAAGGGAILLQEHLVRAFGGKLWTPDDAVLATARGLYKYAQMQAQRRERRRR